MNIKDKYFDLCYRRRIHEFIKIAQYEDCSCDEARIRYSSLDDFYRTKLRIDHEALSHLRNDFKQYNDLYSKYYNEHRTLLFANPVGLIEWYEKQGDFCNYCGISQSKLHKIVESRKGKLTLNQKTKRSKGTLEIEKRDPNLGYTYENSILACPFCNNAKSNLISEEDWRKFFVPAMKNYFDSILQND